jgi:hypothetical protein
VVKISDRYSLSNAAADPLKHFSHYGATSLDALKAYNAARDYAKQILTGSSADDPTRGANRFWDEDKQSRTYFSQVGNPYGYTIPRLSHMDEPPW